MSDEERFCVSFFGLVNQLGQFSREVSATTEALCPLLKKSYVFIWIADHERVFIATKKDCL